MGSISGCNLLVFRDARRTVPGRQLLTALAGALRDVGQSPEESELLTRALLLAGELESAFADAGSPELHVLQQVTDFLASQTFAPGSSSAHILSSLSRITPPPAVCISPQEGFAYYSLHPADMAALAREALQGGSAAVIGIRSIGATLSSVVSAALTTGGTPSERITVRPGGHPFDRATQFSGSQSSWIEQHRQRGSEFLVVDEGPGLSGSSFLSVGDALVAAGIEPARVTFLCSRLPDPAQLRAPGAAHRWPRFRSLFVETASHRPAHADRWAGGGNWRRLFLHPQTPWPASWTTMERSKFLSADGRRFFKFEGLGHYGETVRERTSALAQAGFSPAPIGSQYGYTCFPVLNGVPLRASDVTTTLLDHMARYCAFRRDAMPSSAPAADLGGMLRHNLEQEFEGLDFELDPDLLVPSRPVIVDGSMLPHDWIATAGERILKVDAGIHGDDHFFPGPTDIAWDLAGAAVEWAMDASAAGYLLESYRRVSGDRTILARFPAYLLAYSVFRMSYCKMAAAAMSGNDGKSDGNDEQARLQQAAQFYRSIAAASLGVPRAVIPRAARNPGFPRAARALAVPHTGSSPAPRHQAPSKARERN